MRIIEATMIDLKKGIDAISNLKALPKGLQDLLKKEVKTFSSKGSQFLLGHDGKKLVIDSGGFWDDKTGTFEMKSYGVPEDLATKYKIPKSSKIKEGVEESSPQIITINDAVQIGDRIVNKGERIEVVLDEEVTA